MTLHLTRRQLDALIIVAEEGFEGLANDKAATEAYLGGSRGRVAAEQAIAKLNRLKYQS